MASIKINKNERSWAIEMISQINTIAANNDLLIKRAGGEATISVDSRLRMFPDVILYGDKNLSEILQGWELKMPDVSIADDTFVKDAQRKARTLHLDSCVIWNFRYAQFYVYDKGNDTYEMVRQWANPLIHTREEVSVYRENWEHTLSDVIFAVNDYLKTHQLRRVSTGDMISDSAIELLINGYKDAVSEYLRKQANENSVIEAELTQWWNDASLEYKFAETDMFLAYARNVILNWACRILFAHLIKFNQNEALLVDGIDFETPPTDADNIFRKITAKCDFYNIFGGIHYGTLLPSNAWTALIEFSVYLRDNGAVTVNQSLLQNVLESTVRRTKRDINGQFTTPTILARMLVKMTVHNWTEDVADPCCGTGTIPREIIEIKKGKIGISKAVATTWASDKYKTPLQVANLSMASYDSINKPNRLFQKNVFDLKTGEGVCIVNPVDGQRMEVIVPKFGAICSNLPFVAFENITMEDKKKVGKFFNMEDLDGKTDLSFYMVLYLSSLLKKGGYLGVVISNAWLGTHSGDKFYHALTEHFFLRQVHISGKGRWFSNAQVVTTILILQKKTEIDVAEGKTSFFVWNKALELIAEDSRLEQEIVNAALLDNATDYSVVRQSVYSVTQIEEMKALNISYNALFHDVLWVLDIKSKLVPLNSVFEIFRGSRRGWDQLFYPSGECGIEKEFLQPALLNSKNVSRLITTFPICRTIHFAEKPLN